MSTLLKIKGILILFSGIGLIAGVTYYKTQTRLSTEDLAERFIEDAGSLNGDNDEAKPYLVTYPLSRAAYINNTELMMLLISKGAKVNLRDTWDSQMTPLLWASVKGHTEAAKVLLNHGADIEKDDYLGKTPLIIAAMEGHSSMVQFLLQFGAYVNNTDDEKMTALAWACKKGHVDIVNNLLNSGASVDIYDIHKRTPLIWACLEAHWDIVDLLLSKSASINVEDEYGVTPLIAACMNKNRDYAKKFIYMGADIRKLEQSYTQSINSLINKHQSD